MHTSPPRATLLISFLALAASCNRSSNGQPSEKDCSAGCERSVGWKLAAHKSRFLWSVHEADENVDRVEERAKAKIEELNRLAAAPIPAIPEEKLKGLSPKERAAAISDFEFARKQEQIQDQLGVGKVQAEVVDAKQMHARAKAEYSAWDKSTFAPAVSSCVANCMKRQLPYAECLAKTQAIEDISVCEAM